MSNGPIARKDGWILIVSNDQSSPEGGLRVLLKEDGELENLAQSGWGFCLIFL